VPHANAPLTERGRLRLARCVVEEGWSLRRAAERFQVSVPTAKRWADRYHAEGVCGMVDRSSRPHRFPRATRAPLVRKIKHLRTKQKLGPAMIAGRLGMHASTVHRVLVRERMPRLAHLDRPTSEPIRRYERAHPGDLVHVDIKKLGRIPDGGSWRTHGRGKTAYRNKNADAIGRNAHHNPLVGYRFIHAALDDHSRLAYAEILPDETGPTAARFWCRAAVWFLAHGITVHRVLTDNGSCYRSRHWAQAMKNTDVTHKRTRPYRPQTNGKVERFNRTLLAEWAYIRLYRNDNCRARTLPSWLHLYNHHRPHTALGGQPPTSRVTNLSGQNT
jgi:transposase InsO family protein